MFLDKAKVLIKAGNGGKGCVSFYRSKQTANGGPDGGDGGAGGNIIFRASSSLNTLYTFRYNHKFFAEDGFDGSGKNKTGANGKDVIIDVPCGTIICDSKTGAIIADLQGNGEMFTALKGGLGGRGNSFFATSTRRAPRFSQIGEIVKECEIILELKTIADVGLVGYPNVGKSTLLSVISNARPKIASYAFTTIEPNLGVVEYHDNSFVVADIPGLIEGASEGVGLGHEFLKHIERVRLILHLVDISESEGRSAINDFNIINQELQKYSEKLANLDQIIVLSKCDLLDEEELNKRINNFKKEVNKYKKTFPSLKNGIEIIPISSISNKNLTELKDKVWQKLIKIPKPTPIQVVENTLNTRDKTSLNINRNDRGEFILTGGYIDNLTRGIVLSDYNSFAYFQMRLKRDGIIEKLKVRGLKPGDTVRIKEIEFVWEE